MNFVRIAVLLLLFIALVSASSSSKVLSTRELLELKKGQLGTIKAAMIEVQNLIMADEYYPIKERVPGFVESQKQTLEELTSTMKSVQYQVDILSKLCQDKKGSYCDGKDDGLSSGKVVSLSTSELTEQQKALAALSNDVNSLKETIKMIPSKSANPWVKIGVLSELESLLNSHSPLEYQYGMKYNTITVAPLVIQTWNQGIRVFPEISYSMGDNASSLICGKTIFTKGLQDKESQQGYFYQRYVDCSYKDLNFTSSHDGSTVAIYARKF